MIARHYDDCELVIQSSGERYVVQLLNIHAGEATGEFALPFTQVELSNFYSRIGQAHRATRRADSPDLEAAKKFGDQLFRCVFTGELLSQLRSSVDHAHEHGRGLRIRLRLKGVPDLGELPWEFLYDSEQDHFLATSTMTPMVRYLDLPQSVSTLRVRAPLRILVVLAGPRNLPCLDAEGEWERLKKALGPLEASGAIVLERLADGTLATLRRRARGEPFHVLHFVGHGGFDQVAGDGVLHFESTTGLSDPIPGQMLGNILRDHDTLRLAVLNACEGARQSNQNPFSGVAQSLCQQRLPAVIAMQFEISDDAAKTFAEEFYGAIADGLPVDAAVSESRKALYSGRYGQEWATPVLYMRSPSGFLFDIQKRAKPAAQQEPAKPVQQAAAATQQPAQQQPVYQPPVQPQPVQPRPAPPPPPPPKPAFDIDAERRKLDAERARLEAFRREREQIAEAEARRRAEEQRLQEQRLQEQRIEEQRLAEQRLKDERLRFEQTKAREAEIQRQREEQARRDEQARREEQLRIEQARRQKLDAQQRADQERVDQERARFEEAMRQAEEKERKAAAKARPAPPPPPMFQQGDFASILQPKPSHRVRNTIIGIFSIIGAIFLILMVIGFIADAKEKKAANQNHLALGDQAFAARNYDQAITEYKAAAERHPDLAEAHARLCNAIAFKGENSPGQKGDYEGAIAECEKAVQLNPSSAEAHSNLCNTLNDKEFSAHDIKGNYDRAIAECRRAIQLDPAYAEAQNNLCNAIGTRAEQPVARPNDRKDALTACTEAIRLKPNLAEAYKNLGDLDRDIANDDLDHGQLDPATHFLNEAAIEYRQAINLWPNYQRAETELGSVFLKNKKPQAAIDELNKAIALDPADYAAHYWLGSAYLFAMKDYDKAAAEFRRSLELKPDSAPTEYFLSAALRLQGNSLEANQHLISAYTLDSSDKNIAAAYRLFISNTKE